MRKDEFITANQSHQSYSRRVWRSFIISMALLVIWMIVSVLLFLKSPSIYGYHQEATLDPARFCIRFFGPLLILCVGVFLYMILSGRKAGTTLSCPHCSRRLDGRPGLSVVASGNCPFCGNTVIDNEDPNNAIDGE